MEIILNVINDIKEARRLFPIVDSCIYLEFAPYPKYSHETNKRKKWFIDEFT
jgi:hypothetical protein